jgi:hypothetical protein
MSYNRLLKNESHAAYPVLIGIGASRLHSTPASFTAKAATVPGYPSLF